LDPRARRERSLQSYRRIGVLSIGVAGIVVLALTVLSSCFRLTHVMHVSMGLLALWFCCAAAYALERLYRIAQQSIHRLQDMAIIDRTSWGFEYPYIKSRLREEQARVDLSGGVASVLFIDVAGIWRTSERFGKLDREEVLKDVSKIIRQQMRPPDLLARVSEAVFLIFLPKTDRRKAAETAEALRSAAEAYKHECHDGGVVDFIRFSVGVASYPFNGVDMDCVVAAARGAMDDAIRAGGNRVNISGQYFKDNREERDLLTEVRGEEHSGTGWQAVAGGEEGGGEPDRPPPKDSAE